MFTHQVPPEISCLKEYEKLLVQRAKCFQKITSTKTVINKKFTIQGTNEESFWNSLSLATTY